MKKREYSIAYRGLSVGNHTFEFDCNSSFFNEMSGGEFREGDCKVAVTLERGSNLITINCKISGEILVACDRCLDEFMMPVDFDGNIFVKFSSEVVEPQYDEHGDAEHDVLWMNPADDFIDLEQYIYDSVIISLPFQRIHGNDENGESLCNKDMLSRFTIIEEDDDRDFFDSEDDDEDDDF